MTTTELSKAQLATVLSALDERPRNPANRTEALKAIGKSAQHYGLSADLILAAAPGLLDGRLSAAEFRAELQDHADGAGDAAGDAQESAPAGQEDSAPGTAPEPAHAPQDGQGAEGVATSPAAAEPAPVAAEAPAAGKAQSKPGDRTRRRERAASKAAAAGTLTPREGTKQALLISMLRRPEGATVEEVVEATSWQKHTVRGAISGALKKKLSLDVISEKVEGRGRVYRIAGADAAA